MKKGNYVSAKRVFDFYIEKLKEDTSVSNIFALQYANLKLLRFKTESCLNALYAYTIKAEQ